MNYLKTIVFLLLISLKTFSQLNLIKNLTVEDGLPSNTVYSSFEDSRGFIWFCTDFGVSRYNGQVFENFNINNGLADNDIFNAFEDKWGRIWFASFNGNLSFFKNEQFFNEYNCKMLQRLKHQKFISFFQQEEKDSSFYIVYNLGLKFLKVNKKNIEAIDYTTNLGVINKDAQLINIKKNNNKYCLYLRESYANNENKMAAKYYLYNDSLKLLSYKVVQKINKAPIRGNNEIYTLQDNKLYNANSLKVIRPFENEQIINGVNLTTLDTTILLDKGLIYKYSKKEKKLFAEITFTDANQIKNTKYLTTLKSGVFLFDNTDSKKINIKDDIFLNQENKLFFIDKSNMLYRISNKKKINIGFVDKKQFSTPLSILYLNNSYYLFSYNLYYDFKNKKVFSQKPTKKIISSNTLNEVILYSREYFIFKNLRTNIEKFITLKSNDLIFDNKNVWVSTNNGMVKLNNYQLQKQKQFHGFYYLNFISINNTLLGLDKNYKLVQCKKYETNDIKIKHLDNKNFYKEINKINDSIALLTKPNNEKVLLKIIKNLLVFKSFNLSPNF